MPIPFSRSATLAMSCIVGAPLAACHTPPAHEETAMTQPESSQTIPGYALGDRSLPAAPITLDELAELQSSLLFTKKDVEALRMSRGVLELHVEELVGVWYGFVGANPHLLKHFTDRASGQPDGDYLARVRARFERWVLDTAEADYDQAWLDYQIEIGKRHHRIGKNRTDGVDAAPHIRFVDMIPLVYPIFGTIRGFLEKGDASPERVDAMHHAWLKALLLTITLWTQPYVRAEDF